MGILSKLLSIPKRIREFFKPPPPPPPPPVVKPSLPPPPIVKPPPPPPPIVKHFEVVLHNYVTRKGKSRSQSMERLELRRVVDAANSDEAIHKALEEMRRDLGDAPWQNLTEQVHIDRHISASETISPGGNATIFMRDGNVSGTYRKGEFV